MKAKNHIRTTMIFLFILSLIFAKKSSAQIQSMAGPRIGVTIIAPGETADILNQNDGTFRSEIPGIISGKTSQAVGVNAILSNLLNNTTNKVKVQKYLKHKAFIYILMITLLYHQAIKVLQIH